jgi:6-pyruvoyltetrahydropterin/6-carboxytetrahydropterin synthase
VTRFAQLCIHKDELSFSAGHFTIFSATEREQLHGHNYYVSVAFTVSIADNGLSFDYRYYKKILKSLCDQLDRHFLLPANSPFLTLEENGESIVAHYNHKKIPFLKEDVVVLPITNTTIEELSHWFLENLTRNTAELNSHCIHDITLSVYNGPGQSGSATWKK